MRRTLPTVVLAAVAALGAWLALRPSAPPRVDADDPVGTSGSDAVAPRPVGTTTGLASKPAPPPVVRPPARAPAVDRIEVGELRVRLEAPTGARIPDGLTVDAAPLGLAPPSKSLPVRQEDGTWLYDRLPTGRWVVRAWVPGFVDVEKQVTVERDAPAEVTLPLEPGATATWRISALGTDPPEFVRIVLLDSAGRPRTATYQTSATTIHGPPSAIPVLPTTGTVLGLKAGTYRLRAKNPDDEAQQAEATFTVAVGDAPTIELMLKR